MGRRSITHLEHASRALDKAKVALDEGRLFTDKDVELLKQLQEQVTSLRDTFICLAVASGSKNIEVAAAFKLSSGRVSQIVKKGITCAKT